MRSSTIAAFIGYFDAALIIAVAALAAGGVIAVFSGKLRGYAVLAAFCAASLAAFALEATLFNIPRHLKYFAGPPVGIAGTSGTTILTTDGTQAEFAAGGGGIRFRNLDRKVTSVFADMIFENSETADMFVQYTDEKGTRRYEKTLYKYRPRENYAPLRPRGKVSELTIAFDNAGSAIDVRDIVINKPIPFRLSGSRLMGVSLLLFALFSLASKNLRAKEAALWASLRKIKAKNKSLSAALRYFSLGCAFLLLNGLVCLYYQNIVNKTGGEYVYSLDDTYIHLAVAKNAALHNNWGIGRYEFTSCSSAPLYTFTLSVLMRLFGDSAVYPLLVNIFFGNLVIIALYLFIKNKIWFFAGVILFVTPVLLHVQILSGMEHTMHIFLMLAALMLFSKFAEGGFNDKKYGVPFLCVSLLLCMSRYESMFFLAPVLAVLLLNKRYAFCLATLAAGFLPVLSFGIWSMSNGGFFFPNSLLIKGDINVFGAASAISHYWDKLYRNKTVGGAMFSAAMVMALIIAVQDFALNKAYNLKAFLNLINKHALVFIVLANIILHTLFAGFGQFRYEGYLLALLYLTLIHAINTTGDAAKRCAVALSLIFAFLSAPALEYRLADAHRVMSQAGKNIHDQQIQMSKFLKTYYNESKVMANDIGAISYYTDIKLKDLVGLGSNDVVVLRKEENLLRGGGGGGGGYRGLENGIFKVQRVQCDTYI